MIYIDANVLLSYITTPVTQKDHERRSRADELLAKVADGSLQAITNDVVLHEVCWILGAKHRYAVSASDIIEIIRSILNWPGWSFPDGDHQIYLRALEIWELDLKLEFSDSVIAARAEALGATLATFDLRLAKAYPGEEWE